MILASLTFRDLTSIYVILLLFGNENLYTLQTEGVGTALCNHLTSILKTPFFDCKLEKHSRYGAQLASYMWSCPVHTLLIVCETLTMVSSGMTWVLRNIMMAIEIEPSPDGLAKWQHVQRCYEMRVTLTL